MATYLEAETEAYRPLREVVDSAQVLSLLTYKPKVVYKDVEEAEVTPEKILVRASFNEFDGGQNALMDCVGVTGKRRHKRVGSIALEIFGPRSVGNMTFLMKQLAQLLREAYTTSKNNIGLWYRKPRIMNAHLENSRWRLNVIIDFYYSEVI